VKDNYTVSEPGYNAVFASSSLACVTAEAIRLSKTDDYIYTAIVIENGNSGEPVSIVLDGVLYERDNNE